MAPLAPQTVDIIFAGGGTAACVAAGRLALANPSLRILLIEGGKNNFEEPTVVTPALYLSHLAPDSKTALFYQGTPSPHLNNRSPIVPAGGILGGGSSINFMMYTRAQSIDFDSWETEGWSELAPLRLPTGRRQDAAHTYIHPLLQSSSYPNLQILPESKVVRVLFDSSSPPRATGVEYIPNTDYQPALALSKTIPHTITAEKLVVVSAGALGTPQILERSGVGRREVLERVGVEIVSEVEGVGEAYQDHNLLLYPYKTSLDESETIDNILSGRKDLVQALAAKDPQLGWNGVDICSKLRPTEAEIRALGPDFVADWERDFAPHPSKPLMLCGVVNAFLADQTLVAPGQYITMGVYTAYPYSRGRIHITSTSDVHNGYEFDTGFLSHPSDLKKQVWAYKMQREICRRLPYFRGELELGHPKFTKTSSAALSAGRLEGKIEDITYTAEDDAIIEDWIRGNLQTTWHSLGTCAMKPREKGGVVDAHLNVYGTRGLKICDLSMVPQNVGANTNNTALAIGEKAAGIIGRELGMEV